MNNALTLHAQLMSFLANTIINTLAHSLTQTVKLEHTYSQQLRNVGPDILIFFHLSNIFCFDSRINLSWLSGS